MSALTTYLLSLPGIIYVGNTDVATGTATLTDLTGTFAAGTELNAGVSRAGFGATGFVTGHSTCWASSGSVSRGFQIATAANATAQLQTLTLGVFIQQASANSSPNPLLGRQNGIGLNLGGTRKLTVTMTGGGVTAPARSNPTTMTLASSHLIGVTYDGEELQPWVDGAREGVYQRLPGPFTSFPSKVAFGGDTGATGAGVSACLPFIVAGVLTDGQWATIYELGLGAVAAAQQACFDFVADDITQVAATAAGVRCQGCGGARRVAEGGVKQTNTQAHIACFGASGRWKTSPTGAMPSSPTDRELDLYALRLSEAVLDNYSKRPTTDKPWGILTTGQIFPQSAGFYGAFIGGLGTLHWATGGGPRSPFLQRMKLLMGYLATNQIAPGLTRAGWFSTDGTYAGSFEGSGVFVLHDMLPGIKAVWPALDDATKATWLNTLRLACDSEWAWEPATYWANGNIVAYQWGIYRVMADLDTLQTAKWMGYADAYLDFMVAPQGNTSAYSGSTLTGVGMRRYVDGTPANDPLITTLAAMRALNPMSDKVYLTEGNTGSTGPGTSTGFYGLDWNYASAQMSIALSVYAATGDTDAWQLAQLLANTVQPRHNLTNGTVTGPSGGSVGPWLSDFRGGTRHNLAELGHFYSLHTMRRFGRTDLLSGAQQTGHHTFMEDNAVLNTTQQNVWYKAQLEVAQILENSPYWPEAA
jgi:hypothetical protein